eukprot:5351-Heterococcus_DN1.PRE.2
MLISSATHILPAAAVPPHCTYTAHISLKHDTLHNARCNKCSSLSAANMHSHASHTTLYSDTTAYSVLLL